MSLMSMFFPRREVKTSADAAKERLQIVLSHERIGRGGDDFLPRLQRELVAVVARYVSIDPEKVLVHLDRGNSMSTLEIEIEVPAPTPGQVKKEALPADTSTEEKHIASA